MERAPALSVVPNQARAFQLSSLSSDRTCIRTRKSICVMLLNKGPIQDAKLKLPCLNILLKIIWTLIFVKNALTFRIDARTGPFLMEANFHTWAFEPQTRLVPPSLSKLKRYCVIPNTLQLFDQGINDVSLLLNADAYSEFSNQKVLLWYLATRHC